MRSETVAGKATGVVATAVEAGAEGVGAAAVDGVVGGVEGVRDGDAE